MATLGFGIIGCGMISRFHVRAIEDVAGAELRAVYNRSRTGAEQLANETGVDCHHELDAMLARPDIDIVSICTPSGAHLEPALLAAKAGKHVIIEKPLEVSLKRCDRIIAACRKARVKLCTIFPSRFADANRELKKAIDAGRFGRLTLADTTIKWWRTQEYYDSGGWRGTWRLDGGGALMNQAIHNVDLLLSMMGPVSEVAAFTSLLAHKRIEVEDTAVATLRFANGALGIIEATTSVYPGLLKTIGVHGDKGSVVIEQDDVLKWEFAKPRKKDEEVREKYGVRSDATGGASDPAAISHIGHARQIGEFVKAVRKGIEPIVDGAEGRRSVELIMAVYRSQATGKIVKLPLARDPKLPELA